MKLPADLARLVRRVSRLDFVEGLGISIGRRHVAFAHLAKRLATVSLQHHRLVPLPPPEEGEARRAALTAAIAAFLAEGSVGADRAFVVLPRSSALLARLSLPIAAKNDVQQVVEFELDRLLPVERETIYYDFLVREAGASSDKLDVQIVAVPRAVVAEYTAAIEAAGVRARSVAITPIALLDLVSFLPDGEDAAVAVLLDDAGAIELDLISQRTLIASHLVRASEVGSVAAVERLVADEALVLGSSRESLELFSWRAGAAAETADRGPLPPELLVDGATLVRRADAVLGAPEGFFVSPEPSLAPAIGAALAAVREGEAGLNLLPPEERRASEEGAPLLTFLFAALLVVVTLVWLTSAMIQDYRMSTRLHRELAELEPQIREIHKNEDEAKALRDKLRVLTQGDQRRISTFLRELSDVVPSDAYLSTFRVRNDRVELEGFAHSASDLVPVLEKSKHFKNAQFTSPVTKVQNNQERFSLTTEIEE